MSFCGFEDFFPDLLPIFKHVDLVIRPLLKKPLVVVNQND